MSIVKNTRIIVASFFFVLFFLTSITIGETENVSFLESASSASGCCNGTTGNIDNDVNGNIDINDLYLLIDHLFISFVSLPCPSAANIDGSADSVINIADIAFLIDHLFITFPPLTGCQVSYASDVQPILSLWCAVSGCHGNGSSSGGFSMGAGAPYSTVRNAVGLNGAIIVAGDASSSNLYLKTTPTPPFGSRMPSGGPFLTTDQQNLIRYWIDQGANDN